MSGTGGKQSCLSGCGGRARGKQVSDWFASLLQFSNCHKKIDELFSGKLYLIGIAAIVVAVIMVSVTVQHLAVVGQGEPTLGCPGPVPLGPDPSLASGCPCLIRRAAPALYAPADQGQGFRHPSGVRVLAQAPGDHG